MSPQLSPHTAATVISDTSLDFSFSIVWVSVRQWETSWLGDGRLTHAANVYALIFR